MAPFFPALCSKRIIKRMNHQPGREIEQRKCAKPLFKARMAVCDALECTSQTLQCSLMPAAHKGGCWDGAVPFLQHSHQLQELVPLCFSSLAQNLVLCHLPAPAVCASRPEESTSTESLFPSSQMKGMKQRQDLSTISNTLKVKAECRARLSTSPQHPSLDCNK